MVLAYQGSRLSTTPVTLQGSSAGKGQALSNFGCGFRKKLTGDVLTLFSILGFVCPRSWSRFPGFLQLITVAVLYHNALWHMVYTT